MKIRIQLLTCFVVLITFVSSNAQQKYKYAGTKKCSVCHKSDKRGNQYGIWIKSSHSHAYEVLAGDKAKKIAEEKNIDNPQKSEKCLKCHITGAGQPEENFDSSYKKEEGIGCEACHGPGSAYKKIANMKDRKKYLANGGIVPDKSTCKKCHQDEKFKFDEMWKKIVHTVPGKQRN